MTTKNTLMRIMGEKEDLRGGTDYFGYVNVVGSAYIPVTETPEQVLVGSGAKSFLSAVLK